MRPRVGLTDDEARILVAGMPALLEQYPANPRSNRSFVRAFIRLVYGATKKTFGPTVYRRLIDAYAGDRHPSNDLLSEEKQAFLTELNFSVEPGSTGEIANEIQRIVNERLEQHISRGQASQATDVLREKIEYLQHQLLLATKTLASLQLQAVEERANVKRLEELNSSLQTQIELGNSILLQFGANLDSLVREVTQTRSFALGAIDVARGETRSALARCQSLENQLQEARAMTEVFRQAALSRK